MSHIDTLKVYKEYIEAGYSENDALTQTNILEKSFMTKVKELKKDFVSNRLYNFVGTAIIAVLLAIGGELWYLSKEVSVLSRDMQEVRQFLFKKG